MFGSKNRIFQLMQRVYVQALPEYEKAICRLFSEAENLTDEAAEKQADSARMLYLGRVSELLFDSLEATSAKTFARYQIARCHPEVYGQEEIWNIPDPAEQTARMLSAGMQYLQVYYAFTGKIGSEADAIRHNHMAHACMDEVLNRLEAKLGNS